MSDLSMDPATGQMIGCEKRTSFFDGDPSSTAWAWDFGDGKTETFEVSIKGRVFMLNRMEIGKLYETLNDATNTALKAYALGLYL